MRMLAAAALFAATWLAWSGVYTPLILSLGAVSCILVTVLTRRAGLFNVEPYVLRLGRRLPRFLLWLTMDLIKSNITVARIVLSPRLPIEPTITTVNAEDLPAVGQALLAYSITLTPGSVVTEIHRGMLEVHCLTRTTADELREGEVTRRVRRLTGS